MIQRIYHIDRDFLDLLKERGDDFFKEAQLPGNFRVATFLTSWRVLLSHGIGVMFLAKDKQGRIVSLLGGLLSSDINTGEVIAAEAFWYTLKEFRTGTTGFRLYQAFWDWAKSVGAERVTMAYIHALHPEKMKTFYERQGFKPLETHYVKET